MTKLRYVLMILIIALALLAPFSARAQTGGQVTLEQVNKAIEQLDALAQREIKENSVPGLAIGVVFQDKLIWSKGYGVKDTKTNEPIDADTVFLLASVSKPIGATVVAELVGEGKISWDSKISDLDPAFQMYDSWVTREITLRDMYAHRSGLPEFAGDLLDDLGFTRAEILHRLRFQKPVSSFRSEYAYTNYGMTEAAVAAASAYALSWEDASEQKLYTPLGMTATSSRLQDFLARPNKALQHVLVDGKWVQKFQRTPDAESPAAGVSSSVNDLAKWVRLQLANGKFKGKQIVNEAALTETHKPQMLIGSSAAWGTPGFYGLGWNVNYDDSGRLRLSHSGAFAMGTGTNVNMVPAEQLGVIVLSNGRPTGVPEALASTFLDYAIEGKPRLDWFKGYKEAFVRLFASLGSTAAQYAKPPAAPTPALKNDAYVGTYTNAYFGDIQIVEKDGGLAIVQGPQNQTFALTHFDRDVFTYVTAGENAVGVTGVYFVIGADGNATNIRAENLDLHGNGRFARTK